MRDDRLRDRGFSVQFVFDAVDECSPTGFDNVIADADRAPGFFAVGALDVHADGGGGAGRRINDADLVVDQADFTELRVRTGECFTQSGVERVDWSVSFGGVEPQRVSDFEFDDRLGERDMILDIPITRDDTVFDGFEMRLKRATDPFDQEIEGGRCRFELITLVLQPNDFGENLVHQFFVFAEVVFARDGFDIAAARQFADEDPAFISDQSRIDMFVGLGGFVDRVDVHAAFVREGTLADERLVATPLQVGGFVDEPAQFGELRERAATEDLVVRFLQAEVGDDRDQIDVPATLTDPVDGSLNLRRTCVEGGERISDGEFTVVVTMDAELHVVVGESFPGCGRDRGNFLGERSAIGIAQYHPFCAGGGGGAEGFDRVLRVGFVAVEEMFGVVEHFAVTGQKFSAFADHGEVLVESHSEDFRGVVVPRFSDHGAARGAGRDESTHARIVFGFHAAATRHSERADFAVSQIEVADLFKERDVFFVGQGVATLNEIDPDLGEPLSDVQLVLQRKTHTFSLRSVSQGGVVDGDWRGGHVRGCHFGV